MPLIYKAFQSTIANKDGKKLFYPVLVKTGKVVGTQCIGELIARKSSLTPGDVHNVIRNLMEVMREQLLNSRSVRLDGLGTFTMISRSGGKGVAAKEEVSPLQIHGLHCQFTPEYTRPAGTAVTRALTQGVEYVSLDELAKRLLSAGADKGGGGAETPAV